MQPITLKCRPELLEQWRDDLVKNPEAVTALLALSPSYVAMLIHDAAAAIELQRQLAPAPAIPSLQVNPCRLCQPVTRTVGWTCSGQCHGAQR